ncbi:MAG: CDP-diacylglycerol--serine O-phosphatidyltransferase [Ignavibacteria bacterium]|nr:CDP-diacylglycerol--serine O-phosphatidyltransferase [Ignavibacteria bacterium]
MKKPKVSRSVFPNTFTCLNVFSGFCSIVFASQGEILYSCLAIAFAAIFDALDGLVARLTKSTSKFGVELDSLADVVSFGAAPSFLIYSAFLSGYGIIGIIISSLQLVFGALRLARFNVQLTGFDKSYFTGVPIPFAALTIAALTLNYPLHDFLRYNIEVTVIILSIALALLMVSKVTFDTLPKFTLSDMKKKPASHIFSVAALIVLVISKGSFLFFILITVLFLSILRQIFNRMFKPADKPVELKKEI